MPQLVKNPSAVKETWVQSLGWEDPLEKGKATHSSILAWRISPGSHRVGHNWATFTFTFYRLQTVDVCVMRTFMIYSVSNFQIFNTILLLIMILPQCTLDLHNLFFLITGNVYLLTPFISLIPVASLIAQLVRNLPVMWETWVWPLVGKIPWRR